MDAALLATNPARPAPFPGPAEPAASRQAARSLLTLTAIALAVAALTWRLTDAGLGFLLADSVLVIGLLLGVGRGRPGTAAWLFGFASLWLAGATCWRASDWAIATALPGSLLMLVALGLACARRTSAQRVSEISRAGLSAIRSTPAGIVDAVKSPARALDVSARGHALGVVRGLLIGAPVAVAFAALLAADGRFRRALAHLVGSAGSGLDFALWTLATLCGLLVVRAVLQRVEGTPWQRPAEAEAAAPGPYRTEGDRPVWPVAPTKAQGPRVRPLTWGVVLAQVVAVFGVYVVANVRTLFAGHEHLRAHGTSTYAAYLHEGFTQVSLAALLAVACVGVGHVLLRPRGPAAGGPSPIPGGRALAAVELALLALTSVTLASCAHRLELYEEAYGYTYLRLGVWLLQLGVGGLLAMTGARCVARGWQGFASALVWSGAAFMLLAGSLDADGRIARGNVARARAGAPLDTEYLATLSEDAREVLPAVAGMDRQAAEALAGAWAEQAEVHRHRGWRSLRGLGAR